MTSSIVRGVVIVGILASAGASQAQSTDHSSHSAPAADQHGKPAAPAATADHHDSKASHDSEASHASEHHATWLSDRSDLTESATVVGAGAFHVEIGFGLEEAGTADDRERLFLGPLTLLRVGLGSRLELRAGTRGYTWETIESHGVVARTSGQADAQASLKVQVLTQEGAALNVALIPAVSLPAGDSHFTSDGYDPSVTLALSRHLAHGFGLIGNVGYSRPTYHHERFTRTSVAAGLEHRLIPGTGGYVEILGATSHDPAHEGDWDEWLAGVGMTARAGRRVEFDVQGAFGLTDHSPNWGVGFGVAFRYGPVD